MPNPGFTGKTHTPKHRSKMSLMMVERWKDPAYRAKAVAAIRAADQTRGARVMTPELSANLSQHITERWADPEYRKLLSERMSAGAKKRWSDPEKRAALLLVRESPETKARRVEAVSRASAAREAACYGISIERYLGMTKRERDRFRWKTPKLKPSGFSKKLMARKAKLLGVSADEYDMMSGSQRERLEYSKKGYVRGPYKTKDKK